MNLRKQIISLATANAVEYLFQFFIPVCLVRLLTKTGYADYRIVWLVAATVIAIVPCNMPSSLYYFLPRSNPHEKSGFVINTLFYLLVVGGIAGIFVSELNPWLPMKIKDLPPGFLPAFVFLYVFTCLLDILPNADQDVLTQSKVIIGFSFLRSLAIVLAAYLGGITATLWALVAYLFTKALALLIYANRNEWIKPSAFTTNQFSKQFSYALPFGVASGLFELRSQVDQWIASWALSKEDFAVFCVAVVLYPLISLLRKPVTNVIAPRMSSLEAAGEAKEAIQLNARGNLAVSSVSLPVLAFAFVYADLMIRLVFTKAYEPAASPMRVYVVGLVGCMVESATIMNVLRQGRFVLMMDGVLLILSIFSSWAGVLIWGMSGAALGSTLCVYVSMYFNLRRTSHLLGKPIASLQPWGAMAKLLLAAIVGALFSSICRYLLSSYGVILNILVGGIVFCIVYLLGLWLLGFRRDILITILRRQPV